MTEKKALLKVLDNLSERFLMQFITHHKKDSPEVAGLALEILYRRHAEDLLVISTSVFSLEGIDRALSHGDLLVEAFARAFEKSHTYKPGSDAKPEGIQFKNWMVSILKNLCNRKANEYKVFTMHLLEQTQMEVFRDSGGELARDPRKNQLFRRVEEEISAMDPLNQEVFALYYVEERGPNGKVNPFRLKELANKYGVTTGAIRQRNHRLKQKVRTIIEAFYPV